MNKYEVNYFDHGDWRHHTDIILAESEEQAREYADQECAPEYRLRPYKRLGAKDEDSLRIVVLETNFKFPLVLNEY